MSPIQRLRDNILSLILEIVNSVFKFSCTGPLITSASDRQTQPEHHNIMPIDFSDAVQSGLQSKTPGYVGYNTMVANNIHKLLKCKIIVQIEVHDHSTKLSLDDGIYSRRDNFYIEK